MGGRNVRVFFNKILFGGGHQEALGWTFLPDPRDTEQLLAHESWPWSSNAHKTRRTEGNLRPFLCSPSAFPMARDDSPLLSPLPALTIPRESNPI